MPNIPQIELDITLADLYARDKAHGNDKRIAMVLGGPSSEIALTSKITRNTKFLYQDSTFIETAVDVSLIKREEMQQKMAVKYLSLIPQRDAFVAGNMPVIVFDLDCAEGNMAGSKEEVEKTTGVLETHQRPQLLFFPGPKQIKMKANNIDLLVVKIDYDGLEGFPLAVSHDTHYFLNSKAALCTSGLPSPKSFLLELNGFSADPESCCTTCRETDGGASIPKDCTGTRRHWLNYQIARILSQVSSQQLPFVLKSQQTFAGGGTWFVSTPQQLSELKAALSSRVLPKLLSLVNISNAHLKPATLVVSELIGYPVGNWGLTFFVTRVGECIFLAATHQDVDDTKAWIGSTISYTAQERLKQRFTPIMLEIGAWLHGFGYYGPCGADILETASTSDEYNGSSTLHIVDLNVRVSGSLVLGPLRKHFSVRRGLHEASTFALDSNLARDQFITKFEEYFREGKIVLVSWYEDKKSGVSSGIVVIGARNKMELKKQVAKVKSVCI